MYHGILYQTSMSYCSDSKFHIMINVDVKRRKNSFNEEEGCRKFLTLDTYCIHIINTMHYI